MKPPVVLVPGITATVLRDLYPTTPDTPWGLSKKDHARIAMHPDDTSREQRQPARIIPDKAYSIPYDAMVEELRHDLTPRQDEPRPVHVFGHDWRRPLDELSDALAEFVEDVVARTALMRHYAKDGYDRASGRVDLIGHSMGGLIITGYLAQHADDHRVRKVVTLGTPFGGSFEAVLKIATGTSGLTGGAPSSREREAARLTPSLYHLLPEAQGEKEAFLFDEDSELPESLFDAGLWQHGVIETLAEHIRLHAVDPPRKKSDRTRQARELLQSMLDRAAGFRERVRDFRIEKVGMDQEDWMAIVGIGSETRVRLRILDRGREGPWFDLTSLDRMNGYPIPDTEPAEGDAHASRVTADLDDTGDGTVPFWAAIPPFVTSERLVCVTKDDLGYWEFGDRLLEGLFTNLHGILPSMNRVIKLCAAFLDAESGQRASAHPGIRGRRAPDVALAGKVWMPPFTDLEEEVPREWKDSLHPPGS